MITEIIEAPNPIPVYRKNGVIPRSIFLAGTIDMGSSVDWQKEFCEYYTLKNPGRYRYIFNPRRTNWDSSWEQRQSNKEFNEQVNWEMTALELSESIIINFIENSKSPISLLELGLHASSGKVICVCPDNFWRKGNVEIVCSRFSIPLYKDIHTATMYY